MKVTGSKISDSLYSDFSEMCKELNESRSGFLKELIQIALNAYKYSKSKVNRPKGMVNNARTENKYQHQGQDINELVDRLLYSKGLI